MHHHEAEGFSWLYSGFGVLIVLVIFVCVIFGLIILLRRNTTEKIRNTLDDLDSHELLKRRFTSEEITEAEYESMKKEISVQPDCLELLNRRYAQGLITANEYKRSKKEMIILIDSYFL
jgi:uncharacterized membrane protein